MTKITHTKDGGSHPNSKQEKTCNHYFEYAGVQMESTYEKMIYHEVGISVCRKCGEVRKNEI